MRNSGNLHRYIPEALAVMAGVLTVLAVLPVAQAVRTALFAGALALAILGWLWTMREQRHLKEVEADRADRLAGEKARLERLLEGAISSQLGQGVQLDLAKSLADLARSLEAQIAACFLLEGDIGMLRPQAGVYGTGPGSLQDFLLSNNPNDPVNTVLRTGTAVSKARGEDVPRIFPRGWANGAVLLAPMVVEGEVMGLLAVGAPDRDVFSAKDSELATATGARCGAAIINERQMASSRQQVQHSTVIKELALAVNSTLDLAHVLHLFLGKARGIVDYDRASIVLFDRDSYDVAALIDAEGDLRREPHMEHRGPLGGSLYEAVKGGTLIVRHNLDAGDEYATEAPTSNRLGTTYSEVMVPLRSKGDIAGVVAFRSPRAEAFADSMHEVLYELANLGGMAISNSIAHTGASSQARHLDLLLNSLSEVSRMLTATTEGPEALERRVVETVANLFHTEVAILTRVEDGTHRVVAGFGGPVAQVSRRQSVTVTPGAGLIGAVALQQGTLRLSDVPERDLIPTIAGGHSAGVSCGLVAPMFLDGEFGGALAVFARRPFDDSETSVLTTIANQVAVALRNAELFDSSQRSIWELGNLHEGLQAIASSLDLQQVLDSILSKAAMVSGAQIGSIMLLEEGQLQVQAIHGTDEPTAQSLAFGVGQGIAGQVLATGEPILANDVARHPAFQMPEPGTIVPKALLCVPMRLGTDVIGVINLSNYLRTDVFDEDAVRVVSSLATQTSIAVQNARLYEHLRAERDRLISLEEVLRQDLARDLHDGPVQRLAGMSMNIEVIRNVLRSQPDRAIEELGELDQLVRTTIKEARTMLFELRPLVLETQGLPAALESYAEQFEASARLPIELDIPDDLDRMAPVVEQTMFSIIQEALGNIRKHAHASTVDVGLALRGDHLVGTVRDNGDGFDVRATQANYADRASQSLGMVNMLERAERIGGKVEIDSTPGRGTTVTITVPLRHLEVRKPRAAAS
jgi:signal transduction histidine kinase